MTDARVGGVVTSVIQEHTPKARVGGAYVSVLEDPAPAVRVGSYIVAFLRKRVFVEVKIEIGSSRVAVLKESNIPNIRLGNVSASYVEKPDPSVQVGSAHTSFIRRRFSRTLEWKPQTNYESGLDRGVLYPENSPGVVWNGLSAVEDTSVGGEIESFHFDGIKYLDVVAVKNFQANVTAYSAPKEFGPCIGEVSVVPGFVLTRQPKVRFGMSYRTMIGDGEGYKIHLIYNAIASPTGRGHLSKSDQPAPDMRSWKIDAVPVIGEGFRPTAHFVVDSTSVDSEALALLEAQLYGTETQEPSMPNFARLIALVAEWNPRDIVPNNVTGLNTLASGSGDVTMSEVDGLYLIMPSGRLVESEVGFYQLME